MRVIKTALSSGGEINDPSGKSGNGHQEYNPEVEFEYVDADVWYKKNPETGERVDVTTTDDILDQINDEDEEEDNPPSSSR